MPKLTDFTFSKSNKIPVGLRNLKNIEMGLPINIFGCLLSLLADHASIRLFPAATINISLFRIIPGVGLGGGGELGGARLEQECG